MVRARTKAACDLSAMDDLRNEYDPTYNLQPQIDRARRKMGEKRWEELNREWLDAEEAE